MAISVDTVYQTVQRLLNIEQRGQLPPADFNYFANLAQLDLFRKSFYDKAHFEQNPKGNKELMMMNQNNIDIFVTYAQARRPLNDDGTQTTIPSCLLYTSPSPRDATLSRMPSSA